MQHFPSTYFQPVLIESLVVERVLEFEDPDFFKFKVGDLSHHQEVKPHKVEKRIYYPTGAQTSEGFEYKFARIQR